MSARVATDSDVTVWEYRFTMRFRRSPAEDHGADGQPQSDTPPVARPGVGETAPGALPLLTPTGVEQPEDVIEAMTPPAGAQAVDIGCGRGEALVRVWERWAACGTGIDLYEP